MFVTFLEFAIVNVVMANYHPISLEEMHDFLTPKGFRRAEFPGTREIVFAKRVDVDGLPLSLRVYTGIEPNGASRTVGNDAIRVVLYWRNPLGEIKKVASSKRVHRVKGWMKNLDERLDSLKPGPKCECGAPMVLRKGKNGEFYGCASYPVCKQTKEVK